MKKNLIVLSFFLLILSLIGFTQKQANIWYFGFNAGLDFNSGSPVIIEDGQLNTQEGCAVVSNASGELLFYTDGVTVYDSSHNIMPNGTGLNGHSSSAQSAVIVPDPGNSNQYYIFTSDRPSGGIGIHYSIVDITANGGFGDVTTKNTNLTTGAYFESIGVATDATQSGYWVVVREVGSVNYEAYHLEAGGISGPVISDVGEAFSGSNIGFIKFSACYDKIAMSQYTFSEDIQLMDFDNATGAITNRYTITNIPKTYSIEFSPNGNFLYASSLENNRIYQFDLTAGDINASQVNLGGGNHSETGSLQTGPDGKIYFTQTNGNQGGVGSSTNTYMGVINNPDVAGAGAGFDNQGGPHFTNGNQIPYRGLPTFINEFTSNVIFMSYSDNLCLGEAIDFSYTYSGTKSGNVTWDYGDGNGSNSDNPTHTYTTTGDFDVSLTITDAVCGEVKTVVETITINEPVSGGAIIWTTDNSCLVDFSHTYSGPIRNLSWDFDDSNTSTEESPIHSYATSGDYDVVLTITEDLCGTDIIINETVSVGPSITDPGLSYCSGIPFDLDMGDGKSYCWSSTTANDCDLGTGETISTTLSGSSDQTVYVSLDAISDVNVGHTGGNTQFTSANLFQDFTSEIPLRIKSVEMELATNTGFCNGNAGAVQTVDIALYSGTGGTATPTGQTYSASVTCGSGLVAIPVNFLVNTPGNYQIIITSSAATFQIFIPNSSVPSAPGVITVNNNSSSYSGPFLNWIVGDLEDPWCSPAPVTIAFDAVSCCPTLDVPNIAGGAVSTCSSGGSETLTATLDGSGSGNTSDYTIRWYKDGGTPTLVQTGGLTLSNANIVANGSGDYYVEFELNSYPGCISPSNKIAVTVNTRPTDPTTSAPIEICEGTALELTSNSSVGSGTITYSWSGPLAYTSIEQNPTVNSSATTAMSGTYTVSVTANGCPAANSTDVSITVNPAPDVVVNLGDETESTCSGATVNISDNFTEGTGATITYHDNTPGTAGNQIADETAIGSNGTYYIRAESGSGAVCSDEESIEVTINELPTAAIADGNSICDDGSSTNLPITFTGNGPWTIDYTDASGNPQTEAGIVSSPYDLSVSAIGNYTLTSVSDDKCTNTASGAGTFTFYDNVQATAITVCNNVNSSLGPNEFQIRVTVTSGDLASVVVNETNTPSASFTRIGSTNEWLSNPIPEDNNVSINVTDDNNCSGGVNLSGLQTQCSCPTSGTLTLTGNNPICPSDNSTIEIVFSGGTGPFNVSLIGSSSGTISNEPGTSGDQFTISNEEIYTATIENTGESCTVTAVGSIDLRHHPLPTANISNGNSVCNDGSSTNLPLTLSGTGPWSVDYTDAGGSPQTESGIISSSHNLSVNTLGNYSLSSVTDANCTNTATGIGTFTYFEDVIATATTQCKEDNPSLNDDEFQITVTVSQGDLSSVGFSQSAGASVSFTQIGSSNQWVSEAIDENEVIDLNVFDGNNCNGGTDLNSLNKRCSCPTTSSISIVGSNPICPSDNSSLQVDFNGGIGPFNVTLTGSSSGSIETRNGVSTGEQFTVSVAETYTAQIENEGDNCISSTPVGESLTHHIVPTATISGRDTICSDGSTSGTFQLNFTGSSDWTYEINDGSTTTSQITSSNPLTIPSNTAGSYTLISVSDANCDGTVSGSATIIDANPPAPLINETDTTICSSDGENYMLTVSPESNTSYSWYQDDSFRSMESSIFISSIGDAGTYYIEADNGYCPVVTSQDVVILVEQLFIELDAVETTLDIGESATLQLTTEVDDIEWFDTFESLSATDAIWEFSPTLGGLHPIVVTVSSGTCSEEISFDVLVREPVLIPNAFTPNGDDEHDTFVIQGLDGYPNAAIKIYNRWGALIIDEVYTKPWDGKKYKTGTYYYLLSLNDDIGTVLEGHVSIIR